MAGKHIKLSEKTIEYIAILCKKIRIKNPDNAQSVKMAVGIADYVETYGQIAVKQAEWVCRNADFWGMKRPTELADIVVTYKSKQENTATEQNASEDRTSEIVRMLKRIERKVNALLSKK
jgi:hypothetical protein